MKHQTCTLMFFMLLNNLACPMVAQSQWTDAGDHIHANNASNVVVTDGGKVGIGVGSQPEVKLHVGGSFRLNLGEGLLLRADSDYWGGSNDARVFRMIDGNSTFGNVDGGLVFESFTSSDAFRTPMLTLRRKGGATRVGLGTAFPSSPLRIHGSLTTGSGTLDSIGTTVFGVNTAFLSQVEAGSEILVGGEVRKVAEIVDDSELTINIAFPSDLVDVPYKLTRPLFVVDDGGRVGIGTTEPQFRLTLKDSDYRQLEFDRTEKDGVEHRFYIGPSWADDIDHLGFHTDGPAGSNMMVIKSTGKIGIGTPRPASKLVVTHNNFAGHDSWAVAIDSTTSDASSAVLHLRNAGAASVFFARSDGNVGIGVDTPATTLDVGGPIAVSGTTVIDAAGQWKGDVPGVDLTSDQSIDGTKTFTQRVHAAGGLTSLDTVDVVGDISSSGVLRLSGQVALARNGTNISVGGGASSGGSSNTFVGWLAGDGNTTGGSNTFIGQDAGKDNTIGGRNTFVGRDAGNRNEGGDDNVFIGDSSGGQNVSGHDNTALGSDALRSNTGDDNIAIGKDGGADLTSGDNNICIGNQGVAGDSDTIRIGSNHARAFIDGVRNVLTDNSSRVQVYIDNNGQLGTVVSARRFKTDIQDISEASKKMLQLRPVSFRYKQTAETRGESFGHHDVQYGLIAEEVEEVFPELVAYDLEGRPETIRYHLLNALLLNELQKQQRLISRLENELSGLKTIVHDSIQ